MYKHLFFDFDGTLYNGYPHILYSFKRMMKELRDIDIDSDFLYSMFMQSSKVVYEYYKITEEENLLYRKYHNDLSLDPKITLYDGVKDMLIDLVNKGYKLYMYTNRGDSMFELLDNDNIKELFTDFIKHSGKPNPNTLNDMVNKYNLSKSECLVIGDRDIDILGGINANIDGVFIGSNNKYAKYQIDKITDLYNILR